jgi:hypothetical protein
MDILIWICLAGSAIAWLLMWVGDRLGDRLNELEVVKYVNKKVGRGLMVLWVLFLLSPFFLALGYWVTDTAKESLIEFSETSTREKLVGGFGLLGGIWLLLWVHVEDQVAAKHRIGSWIVAQRRLRVVGMAFIVIMVLGLGRCAMLAVSEM